MPNDENFIGLSNGRSSQDQNLFIIVKQGIFCHEHFLTQEMKVKQFQTVVKAH